MKPTEQIVFGGGCFWCIEAVIQRLKGVETVEPGYTGGTVPGTPTYREVCSGLTGHAEVIRVSYNPEIISFHDLILIFMTSHDPTTLNRQGGDRGTQYRSVIYYEDLTQKKIIETVFNEIKDAFESPIVTEVSPLQVFHSAEAHHHDYYNNNSSAGYCTTVINPKIAKLKKLYANRLKEE